MNILWPSTSRISCLSYQTIFRTCQKVDSLAVRLAHGSARTYFKQSRVRAHEPFPTLSGHQGRISWRGSSAVKGRRPWIRTIKSTPTPMLTTIITKYDQLPPDYMDEEGLKFRGTPFSKAEAKRIFKDQLDVDMANHITRVLHGRRVAGTLQDPSLTMKTANTTALKISLAWLRKHVPVDEVECAGLRAEQELAEMEAEIVSDAERIGLYKPSKSGKPKVVKGNNIYAPNSTPREDVYGESGLDKIRKDNLKRLDQEDAIAEANRRKQAEEIGQNTGPLENIRPKSKVELNAYGQNPRIQYHVKRAEFLPDKPLEMSTFRRLWPSFLVALAVIGASLLFVEVYIPPQQSRRFWPDVPPSAATMTGLIFMNVLIYALWHFPPAFRMLNMNFIFYPGFPRPLSLIGSIFSQQRFSHLAANMICLYFVGTRLHDEIGRSQFLAVFMSTGAIGGFTSLAYYTFKKSFITSSLGASGAICGIIACYLMLNSTEKVTVFGLPPEGWPSISCLVALLLLMSTDVIAVVRRSKNIKLDHWNHLGGYVSGIGAAQLIEARIRYRKELERQRRANMGLIDRVKEGRL